MPYEPTRTYSSSEYPWTWWQAEPKPDDGLFYVRWWGAGSTKPVEHMFTSRKEAEQKMNEFLRIAPYVRIEFLEAVEWGTRTRSKA